MYGQELLSLMKCLRSEIATQSTRLFLGLDISLRSSGIAVLRGDGTLLKTCNVRTLNSGVLMAGHAISTTIQALASEGAQQVELTGVEDFAQGFAPNSSSSQTRFTLARINGIASYEAWRLTGAPVLYHSPARMRAYFGLKSKPPLDTSAPAVQDVVKGSAASKAKYAKQVVLSYVQSVHPAFVDYLHEHAGGTGSAGNLPRRSSLTALEDAGVYDRADAVLTGMYTLVKHYEWQAIANESVWWPYVHACLPHIRLGRSKVGRQTADEDKMNHILPALRTVHEEEMSKEKESRVVLPLSAGSLCHTAEAVGSGEAGAKKVKTQRRKPSAAAPGKDAASIDDVAKLYSKLRGSFTQDCRSLLLGEQRGRARRSDNVPNGHGERELGCPTDEGALLRGWRLHE